MIKIDENGVEMEGTALEIVNECLNILINTKYFLINTEDPNKDIKEYVVNKFKTEAIKILACNSNEALEAIGLGIDPDEVHMESWDVEKE